MLSGLLVYSKTDAAKNEVFIEKFLEEAKSIGVKLTFCYREELYIGVENGKLYVRNQSGENMIRNFAIIRCIDPIFTRQLELLGMKTFNSAVVSELCNDKAKTYQLASMLSIPIADTTYMSKGQPAAYPTPFVAKNRFGRGGDEVFLIEDATAYEQESGYITQQVATKGKDVRAFVLGKEIIAAILRSNSTDFRANLSLGGEIEVYQLGEAEKAIIERLVATFDFGLVGIDFVYNEKNEPLLNEIEDVVGSRSLTNLTDLNIPSLYLKHIKKILLGK